MSASSPDDFDDLEALYTQSLLAQKTRPSARTQAARPPAHSTFEFPLNWTRERVVALIHGPTGTLLGNFALYHHNSVAGAHRYVREEGPVVVSGCEFVEGTWWLDMPEPARDKGKWSESRRITAQAILPSLGLHSPAALLDVKIYLHAISRIELASATEFACDAGDSLITLPAGTDIRALLSRECKLAIRQEVLGFFDSSEV